MKNLPAGARAVRPWQPDSRDGEGHRPPRGRAAYQAQGELAGAS